MIRRRWTTARISVAQNTATSVNSYMFAVGQRPAATPRSTMPASSSAIPTHVRRARDALGARRTGSARAGRSDPAAAETGAARADERGLPLTRCDALGDAREVHGVRDERDGERGRGGPDQQGAQVTGVHGVPSRSGAVPGASGQRRREHPVQLGLQPDVVAARQCRGGHHCTAGVARRPRPRREPQPDPAPRREQRRREPGEREQREHQHERERRVVPQVERDEPLRAR